MKTIFAVYDDMESKENLVEIAKFKTEEEALKYAEKEWEHLSDDDKELRDEYFVGIFEVDDDGCLYDCIKVIKQFKYYE